MKTRWSIPARRISNSLLKSTHLGLKCRLITYGRRYTSEKCGNLGTCLGETENIIDEKKNVLSTLISEILSHCKYGKTYSHSCPGGLVHLTEDHGGLIDNSRLGHLVIKVITFTGTLTYTCEYGISAVLGCDVSDKLLDEDRLTYAGTSEKSDLTTLLIRAEEVNDLDAGLEKFGLGRLLFE